jgi:excisionase family DNA binding protein
MRLSNQKQESGDHKLLKEKEAAEYLRISRTTLWRLRKNGKISFSRIGSQLLYDIEEDLETFLARTKQPAFAAID